MTSQLELRLHGTMDHLRIVWEAGETLLESILFEEDPEGTRYHVLLALQEMLTNVLRHAYQGNETAPVVVMFDTDDREVSVEIRDCGPEFNPVVVEFEPDAHDEPPAAGGGYGIMITKVVMDDVTYRREGEWNVLRMCKAIRSTSRLQED